MNKRKVEFIKEKVTIVSAKDIPALLEEEEKKVILRYLLTPSVIQGGEMKLRRTRLEGEPFQQRAVSTGEEIGLVYDLLVNSTGFAVEDLERGKANPSLNILNNRISNSNGCILSREDKVVVGSYTVGWAKSGPKGIID